MIPSVSIGPRTLLNDCNHSATAILWRSAIPSRTILVSQRATKQAARATRQIARAVGRCRPRFRPLPPMPPPLPPLPPAFPPLLPALPPLSPVWPPLPPPRLAAGIAAGANGLVALAASLVALAALARRRRACRPCRLAALARRPRARRPPPHGPSPSLTGSSTSQLPTSRWSALTQAMPLGLNPCANTMTLDGPVPTNADPRKRQGSQTPTKQAPPGTDDGNPSTCCTARPHTCRS